MLSDLEIASIRQFRSYTDGVSFACLRARVMVMLDDESSKDIEKLKAKAHEHMNAALSEHPDMSTWDMDDGYAMVGLPSGIFAISETAGSNNLSTYFSLRGDCLEACEDGEIIAVAYEEE